MRFLLKFLICFWVLKLKNATLCDGTWLCERITQSQIRADDLSKEICFKNEVNFSMGTDEPIFKSDGEGPAKEMNLEPFCIDLTAVSNLQFLQFVKETNYKTEAENFGDSLCLKSSIKSIENIIGTASTPWWLNVRNATWFSPEGPGSNINKGLNHPVVHISWNDANHYCKYFNKRLPTEAEWEYSCRGGLKNRLYPWGNNMLPKNKHLMNIWQGDFPEINTKDDGFEFTAPVDYFDQNRFHMKNIVGNVWEWVDDWWSISQKRSSDYGSDKVKKGGSFMCHPSFCYRYRCAARSKNSPDTTAMNIGFRCAH